MAPRSATAFDLLALARSKWVVGQKLDLGLLADELSVSRDTVLAWAGTREQLYGAFVWEEVANALEEVRRAVAGKRGAALFALGAHRLMEALLDSRPLQCLIRQDADLAMRVLLSCESSVEQRLVDAIERSLRKQMSEGQIDPVLDPHDLAYTLVRVAGSFMYRDIICGVGERADVDAAVVAIEVLVGACGANSAIIGTRDGHWFRLTRPAQPGVRRRPSGGGWKGG